jgi:tetratricopeptide (TPR) repeat protein
MQPQRVIAGRYQIGELIGRGGMGAVFHARDLRTGQAVAVKELRYDVLALDPQLLDRFRRETETLRRLDHPSIVKLLDALEVDDRQYLVMEYVPGGSLEGLLRRQGPLPVRRALEIALDLADALARVHRLGVVHRDIKPANVLLAADGTPRLTDFGAAYEGGGSRLTETGVMIGTFAYLSPEVCEGAPPDARADIWAFGVLLFEMLAGRRPFEGSTPGALLGAILTMPAPHLRALRRDVPVALAELVAAMLEKDRAHRIASARLVGATVEQLLRDGDPAPAVEGAPAAAPASRFASRTDTATVEAPALLSQLLASYQPPADTALVATVTAPVQPAARPIPRSRWLVAALLVVALTLVAVALALRQGNTPQRIASVPASQSAATVEPVAAGEHMLLVARLERLGGPERDEGRFIADNLRQALEVEAPFSRIRVRSYPQVITSEAEARAAAEASGAALVVWGNDQGDHQELNVQVGVGFPGIGLDRALVAQAANVRLRLADARRQTVAPYALGALSMLQNADGDVYETVRTIAIMDMVGGEPAEPLGSSVGAHYHRATASFVADPAAAVAELDQAIRLAGGNPLLYTSRALAYQRLRRLDEARRDIETARRLGPPGWAVPRAMLAVDTVWRGDLARAIGEYDAIVAARPGDWFPPTYRGALRYLAGERPAARADLERAIALGPDANYPYALATLLALRDGRLADAAGLATTIVREFPDPALGSRILEGTFGTGAGGNPLGPLIGGLASLAIGQYDQALAESDAALAAQSGLSDAHLLGGLALCNLGRDAEAEARYSQGLAAAPGDALLHLLRAESRLRRGNTAGAEEDLAAAAQAPAFEAHAAAVRAGTLGCETLLGARP